MKWHQVMASIIPDALADTVLAGIYGTTMRYAGSAPLVTPCLEWQVIADGETELWAPCTIQFDQWTTSLDDLAASELALRRLFHLDVPTEFAGLGMWAQYVDGNPLVDAPNRDGYFARAIRFRFTPLRDRYQTSPTP